MFGTALFLVSFIVQVLVKLLLLKTLWTILTLRDSTTSLSISPREPRPLLFRIISKPISKSEQRFVPSLLKFVLKHYSFLLIMLPIDPSGRCCSCWCSALSLLHWWPQPSSQGRHMLWLSFNRLYYFFYRRRPRACYVEIRFFSSTNHFRTPLAASHRLSCFVSGLTTASGMTELSRCQDKCKAWTWLPQWLLPVADGKRYHAAFCHGSAPSFFPSQPKARSRGSCPPSFPASLRTSTRRSAQWVWGADWYLVTLQPPCWQLNNSRMLVSHLRWPHHSSNIRCLQEGCCRTPSNPIQVALPLQPQR